MLSLLLGMFLGWSLCGFSAQNTAGTIIASEDHSAYGRPAPSDLHELILVMNEPECNRLDEYRRLTYAQRPFAFSVKSHVETILGNLPVIPTTQDESKVAIDWLIDNRIEVSCPHTLFE